MSGRSPFPGRHEPVDFGRPGAPVEAAAVIAPQEAWAPVPYRVSGQAPQPRNDGYASDMAAPVEDGRSSFQRCTSFLCLALNSSGVLGPGGTDDHGDTFGTATNLPLGSSMAGRIDHSDDRDVFRLDLSGRSGSTDVWVYTSPDELDTLGWLYDDRNNNLIVVHNDDGFIGSQRAGFHIRWVLPEGSLLRLRSRLPRHGPQA